MPPHELKLKKGAIVMLLRNINTRAGLCNGPSSRNYMITLLHVRELLEIPKVKLSFFYDLNLLQI